MTYPKIPLAQTVIQLCRAKNIKHIVLSPGSRNAPLTIGFTHDDFFTCYSIVDERSAAFFAMGIAQQIKAPVVVVCTSGSAVLNYFPAVAEAFYSHIPLVVISADRPNYLVCIGDGQTINQKDVFGSHISYAANLKEDINEESPYTKEEQELSIIQSIENKLEHTLGLKQNVQEFNESEINNALNTSISKQLPVHINCPFNEPLYDRVNELSVVVKPTGFPEESSSFSELETFKNLWQNSTKKIVLVGVLNPNSLEQQYVNALAKDESVLILSETTSNLHHDKSIPSIDKLIAALTDVEFKELQPDVLLTIGGLVVSKKIKQFLRKYKPKAHYHVGIRKANDTFFILNHWFKMPLNTFFKSFTFSPVKSSFQDFWTHKLDAMREKHKAYMTLIPYSDFKVFHHITQVIPSNYMLQSANSSIIRYLQLFDLNSTLKVFCNRGTSGIDGSTSTAIGASTMHKQPTLCITGDLSFFYDSNALWNNYIPNNFKIIVMNNSGGGIFRILPGHKNTENFDTYFETKHQLTAEHLCKMYGFEYNKAENSLEVETEITSFFAKDDKPQLLEIFTPSEVNDTVLLDYFKYIK